MRFRVLLAVAAFACAVTPVARAATLPDLPGMGPAQKAVAGHDLPQTSTTASKPALPAVEPSTTTTSAAKTTISPDAVKTIKSLPGTAVIPVIGATKTAAHSAIPGPDGLVVIAALGSFAALAALYMLRRLGRI